MLALHRDLDVVIGVDTHNYTHTAAAVSATGAVLEHLTVPDDAAGYSRLMALSAPTVARPSPWCGRFSPTLATSGTTCATCR